MMGCVFTFESKTAILKNREKNRRNILVKITIVCDVLGEENNGTTIAAMNLIRSLKAKGHNVTVVCPDESRRDSQVLW